MTLQTTSRHEMTARQLTDRVQRMSNTWSPRRNVFIKWYKLIQLHNDLKQDNMESVISSDPRTGFNMAKWLLTPKTSGFRVDSSGMNEEETLNVGVIEQFADRQLALINRRGRTSLFGTALQRLVGLMLATGWYAVATVPVEEGWVFQVWNPATVFPEYGSEGDLVALGRKYTLSADEANMKVFMSGWNPPSQIFKHKVTISSLWRMTPFGPAHGVAAGSHLLKPMELASHFRRIPVITGPVSGLPDDGTIMTGEMWRAEVGESLVAPIIDVQKNFDKMLTYLQQLVRDTANPRWVERVKQSGKLRPEDLFKRGAIFSIEPDEDIFPVATPPLPAEMRGHQFELRGQVQRGLFSDISFGNVTQQISGFLMSNITAASKQTLDPFFRAVKAVMGEAATMNIQVMRNLDFKLGDRDFPDISQDLDLDFEYDIEIPGDFIQRVSAARVANPNFKLSTTTLHSVMFPEVQNSIREQGRVRAEEATENPIFRQVLLLRELSRGAREARTNNDEEMAQWLERAADQIEQSSFGPVEPGTIQDLPPGIAPNALPPEVQEVLAGRG